MSTEESNNSHKGKNSNSSKKTNQKKYYFNKRERKGAKIDNEEYVDLASSPEKLETQRSNKKYKRKSGDCNDFKTKWKTEICHNWEMNGYCQYGENCAFAHGTEDMRNRKMSSNYKTKPCNQFFENGFCCYGSRCQFSHKSEAVVNVSYYELLIEFNRMEQGDDEEINEEKILKRPRLMTFETIAQSNGLLNEYRTKLYEDVMEVRREMKLNENGAIKEEEKNSQRSRFLSI